MGVVFFPARLVRVWMSVFGSVVVGVFVLVLNRALLMGVVRVLGTVGMVRHWVASFVC
jgi:hypothetical protein